MRMLVHAGEARMVDDGNYAGQAIIRAVRLRAIAHGGQVLVSAVATRGRHPVGHRAGRRRLTELEPGPPADSSGSGSSRGALRRRCRRSQPSLVPSVEGALDGSARAPA